MPIRPPALDDRNFDDLVEELLARIPAHTPEWTNPRQGDPGRTLIELFAWLADTLLYRANLIPERQRLAFLRLLGVPARAAIASQGIVTLSQDDKRATRAVRLRPYGTLKGPVSFESIHEITVLPISAEVYYKRPLAEAELVAMRDVVAGLQEIYQVSGAPVPYVTSVAFAGGLPETGGFQLAERTADKSLWLALLAAQPELVAAVRETLGDGTTGSQQVLNVGVVPALHVPALFEQIGPRARIPHVWEMTFLNEQGDLDYLTLDEVEDGTAGLTRPGVVRLLLPAARFINAPSNDVRQFLTAGVGDTPPRLDAAETAERLVSWLRLRPSTTAEQIDLSWVGVNALEIDQLQTLSGRVVGISNGAADQELQLPGQSVQPETLVVQVEETGRGYQPWQRIDDLALAGRDAAAFTLDAEAGSIRFGDGVRGRIPEVGRRVRVATMRAGGGAAGNLPAGTLTEITGTTLDGTPAPKLKVFQPLAMEGGADAETLEQAERRIPSLFRHGNRAVTADDYQQLAAETPGVRLGRVELLPRFKPQQRRSDVPGVVSVMVLPYKDGLNPPNPRADRPTLESVHAYLDARRPLATELYVIGCEYVPLGVGTAVTIRNGFGREEVLSNVRDALRRFLWSLAPGGVEGNGWPLGTPVRDREVEVVIAQVPGVSTVAGVNLFERQDNSWRMLPRSAAFSPVELSLQPWQLPELLTTIVLVDDSPPSDLSRAPNPFALEQGIAIPVVPEECC